MKLAKAREHKARLEEAAEEEKGRVEVSSCAPGARHGR